MWRPWIAKGWCWGEPNEYQGLSEGDRGPSSGRESHDLWEGHPAPWADLEQKKAEGLEAASALGWSVDGPSRTQPRQLTQSAVAVKGT